MNKKNCIDYLKKIKEKLPNNSYSLFLVQTIFILENFNKEYIFSVLSKSIKCDKSDLEYFRKDIFIQKYYKFKINISEFLLNNLEL